MDKLIKIFNNNKFDVGIELVNKADGINIRHGSFALVSDEDIAYNITVNTLFQRGVLKIAEGYTNLLIENGLDFTSDDHFLEDDDIKKKFGMSAKKLEEWVNSIDDSYLANRVYDIAMTCDLPTSKMAIIKKLAPNKELTEE